MVVNTVNTDTVHASKKRSGMTEPMTVMVAEVSAQAPSWLVRLAADERYLYRDIRKLIPTDGHLIHDALFNDDCVANMYYFIENLPQVESKEAAIKKSFTEGLEKHPQEESKESTPEILNAPKQESIDKPLTPAGTTTTINSSKAEAELHNDRNIPEVRVGVYLGPKLCGHRSIVHGGFIATLMDEISGAAAFVTFGPGVFTANLNVNYLKPLPALTWVEIRARATNQEGRKTWISVSVENGEGEMFAQGTALFVLPKWKMAAESR